MHLHPYVCHPRETKPMNRRFTSRAVTSVAIGLVLLTAAVHAEEATLIAHWKLDGDVRDASPNQLSAENHGANLSAPAPDSAGGKAAMFDGRMSFIEIPHAEPLALGTGEFSLTARVNSAADLDDVLGEVMSKYDPQTRRGFTLTIKHNVGGTTSQANYRHVQFGIDNNHLD